MLQNCSFVVNTIFVCPSESILSESCTAVAIEFFSNLKKWTDVMEENFIHELILDIR